MPFTMTHLIIAKNVAEAFDSSIDSFPQFYLGSIAPDAVHNRANYISDYKKISHLITGTEPWGMTTSHDEWKDNIITFLQKHRWSENHDFILGYCSHVLSDMYNSIHIWTPFRLKYADELQKGVGNLHHLENNKIDIALALTYEGRNEFWLNLAKSNSIDFANMIYAEELDKQKDNIRNLWFKDKKYPDLSANKIRTYEGEMDFIKNATAFVVQIFQEQLCS